MAKRLLVLVAMLASAVPALAQGGLGPAETITATGVIKDLGRDCNECAHHGITDEASGAVYELLSDPSHPGGGVDLRNYVDERVTIHGTPQTQSTGRSDVLFVTQVKRADAPEERVMVTFELTVTGNPPEGMVFASAVGQGDLLPLYDLDGDGIYTGSRVVSTEEGIQTLPVQILQANEATKVIKDFGLVKFDEDKTFEASVSFPDNGGSSNGSGSDSGNSGGSASGGSGSSNAGGSSSGGAKALPATGGALLIAGLLGALLVGGGLLVRRIARQQQRRRTL